MTEFDAYHKWLGILPKDQPPHHYRLLGIELFESDPDVIDSAADKQMTYLRSCASGPHVAHSQRILNELAAARVCLLNPAKKSEYDAGLKRKLAPDAHASNPGLAGGIRRRFIGISVVLVAGLAVVALVAVNRQDQKPIAPAIPRKPAKVAADDTGVPKQPARPLKASSNSSRPAEQETTAPRPRDAANVVLIVDITPPEARVLVTGDGVTVEGTGDTRTIRIQKPDSEHTLIASADGYKTTERKLDARLWAGAPMHINLEPVAPASVPVSPSAETPSASVPASKPESAPTVAVAKPDTSKPAAVNPDKPDAEKPLGTLERAAAAYRRELAEAKRDLLKQFDRLNAPLMQQASRTDAALKGIDIIASERKLFESSGVIPWSEPMRPFAAAYLQAIDKAGRSLRKAYLPAIQAQTRRKNASEAARLRAELDYIVAPSVVARWNHRANNDPIRHVRFYSNGALGNPESDNRWSCDEKGLLELRWRNPDAPKGMYIDKCKVSGDGKTYTGRGNTGATISGTLAND